MKFVILTAIFFSIGFNLPIYAADQEHEANPFVAVMSFTKEPAELNKSFEVVEPNDLRVLLSAEWRELKNPYCIRDTLLKHSMMQAILATGISVSKIKLSTINMNGVLGVRVDPGFSISGQLKGAMPFTFCELQ